MHILFLTDNFPPEGNAPAARTYEHAIRWVRGGHQVTVITGAPNFPEGIVFDGYSNRWYLKEMVDGISVVRVKTYIAANSGVLKRILDYMSFMITGCVAGLFQKKIDVVIATSPQFFNAIGGWILAFLRQKPFIFELRDIWPASIITVGAIKNRRIIGTLEKIELFLYKKSTRIICLTQAFKEELVRRGIDSKKIDVILNGVDLNRYRPTSVKDIKFTERFNLTGKFVVGYIGTHGMAHGLEHVIDTADALRDFTDIQFLFVGGGATRERLEHCVQDRALSNVTLMPRQPKEEIYRVWSLCDVSLVHLRDESLFQAVIPSKIFESMGMGIPMIVSMPTGEATDIVRSCDAGIVVPPESPMQLAEAVLALRNDPGLLSRLATNSAKSAYRYSRDTSASEMADCLQKAL